MCFSFVMLEAEIQYCTLLDRKVEPLIQEMLSIEQVILDAFIGLKRSRFLESLALLLILLLVLSNMNTDDFTILFNDYLMLVYGFKLAGKNVYELKLDFCA